MLKIGPLFIQTPLIMAPMAGYTDTCTRRMAKKSGAGLLFTEMISSAGLVRNHKKTFSFLAFHPEEKPLGVQIFGAKAKEMAEAANIVENEGASFVDLNLGCPARKVCRNGAGSALLLEPDKVKSILESVRNAIQCPLTIKIRLGWDAQHISVSKIAQIAEECGVDAITLHPRTRSQGFQGKADWRWIIRIKQERGIPIIGNGDIVNPQGAYEALAGGLCDGVMIGRAARGNPWIFSQARDLLAGKSLQEPSAQKRYEDIMLYLEWQLTQYGREDGLRRLRFLLLHYIKGMPGAGSFRAQLTRVENEDVLKNLLREFFIKTPPEKY